MITFESNGIEYRINVEQISVKNRFAPITYKYLRILRVDTFESNDHFKTASLRVVSHTTL